MCVLCCIYPHEYPPPLGYTKGVTGLLPPPVGVSEMTEPTRPYATRLAKSYPRYVPAGEGQHARTPRTWYPTSPSKHKLEHHSLPYFLLCYRCCDIILYPGLCCCQGLCEAFDERLKAHNKLRLSISIKLIKPTHGNKINGLFFPIDHGYRMF